MFLVMFSFLTMIVLKFTLIIKRKKKTIFTKNGQNKDDAHVSFQDQLWLEIYLENAQFKHGIEFECKRKKKLRKNRR